MLRDALTISLIALCAIVALFHPWIGVMSWTVISIMNPHRYAWIASELPVAAAIAIATLAGIIVTRDRIRFVATPPVIALIAFMLWMCITLPFSILIDPSRDLWGRVMKIDAMILVAVAVLVSRKHVMALAWVLVVSIGFYGLKGGIFTIANGGDHLVWGPPGSFIEGNNELALALVMTIPLMRFVQMQTPSRWVKHGMTALMLLSAASALGTRSRGALVAIIAMSAVLWIRDRRKLASGVLIALAAVVLVAFFPEQWGERMSSIGDYEQDPSAMGRINAWWMAFNLAKDRFFGGGFAVSTGSVFAVYAPIPDDVHAAHSIYFEVLGEHGFVGLGLFLLLWLLVWRSASWLRANGPKQAASAWTADLGAMCHASIAAYAVGGAFLSLAYFDLPYNILVLLVVARRWVEEKGWETESITAPRLGDATALSREAKT
jgi:probable O-glycosylation ligase (exosortase A-associated)